MYSIKKNLDGFSLVEVLVFISILSLFFIVAVAVVTATIRNMKISEHKILAVRYGEELLEWLRSQKEIDWNSFVSQRSGKTYCFDQTPITSWSSIETSCGSSQLINSLFKRQVTITSQGNPVLQTDISITVSWSEPGGDFQAPIKTVFTLWEQ